nr:hypothetical protein [Tanacetum cinerariifolium]
MTGNQNLFSTYQAYNGGNVIFGSNLRGNIISKGQICDNKCRVTFSKHDSEITKDSKVICRSIRKKDLYVMKLGNKPKDQNCLAMINENSTLWHRRLGHANMYLIQSKQAHASHKAKNIVSTTRCLELLHMDLFGPSTVRSYKGNRYTLVIVDDYSRKIKESLNVTFDETPPPSKTSPLVDDDLVEEEAIKVALRLQKQGYTSGCFACDTVPYIIYCEQFQSKSSEVTNNDHSGSVIGIADDEERQTYFDLMMLKMRQMGSGLAMAGFSTSIGCESGEVIALTARCKASK